MSLITWTDQLSVGVAAIDSDHQLLVSLINQLEDAVEDGQGRETVASVLNALIEYTDYHFHREEMLMEAAGFADIPAHRQRHADLKKQVVEIRDRYLVDARSVRSDVVLEFMRTWLTDHIMGSDQVYVPAMKAHPEAVAAANRAFNDRLRDEMSLSDEDLDGMLM